ncbi:hypothetical protein E3U43_017305 [Larimichthys crocea]|uniref:Uncharacterized protein n=1 Tax=Larimichthys crocea TaxID=215358 RepID=A0ACD3QZ47_LARCR|nr:hypothetical protein E3U43_017305 [Larimichthys crocea]
MRPIQLGHKHNTIIIYAGYVQEQLRKRSRDRKVNLSNTIKHQFLLVYGCKDPPEPLLPCMFASDHPFKPLAAVLDCVCVLSVYTGLYDCEQYRSEGSQTA